MVMVQAILFFGHWFIYETWVFFQVRPDPPGIPVLAIVLAVLSVTFLTASILAWRYSNWLVRIYYTASAVWLGFFTFVFLAAGASWIFYAAVRLLRLPVQPRDIAIPCLGIALGTGAYGIVNAARVRVRRVTVRLPNLPASWHGRVAALVTDMHLGHVRGVRFAKRMVAVLLRARPDIVLIGGDLYDGTAGDAERLAAPLRDLSAPLGTYFISGNHEEFRHRTKFLQAAEHAGIRVLNNEKVIVDGLQLVGVHYRDSVYPEHFRSILRNAEVDPGTASVLLTHSPNHVEISADEKITLQLSGHTHRGQFFPFTLVTSRVYGAFVYGLHRIGSLFVYTSSGAGTWGPPIRVGTHPEIVLLCFE